MVVSSLGRWGGGKIRNSEPGLKESDILQREPRPVTTPAHRLRGKSDSKSDSIMGATHLRMREARRKEMGARERVFILAGI